METPRGPVLVVDDDVGMRVALRDTLADEGYKTVEVSGGQQALEYLRVHPPPAMILLDWNMAPMNAPQFLKEASHDSLLAETPVVLITADVRASEKAKIYAFGGYLMKPVNLDSLFELVGRYCR
jgi:two-component system chemotaxis response regulator CheY